MREIEESGRNRLLPVSAAFHQFPVLGVATNDATVLGPFYLSVVYGTMVAVTSFDTFEIGLREAVRSRRQNGVSFANAGEGVWGQLFCDSTFRASTMTPKQPGGLFTYPLVAIDFEWSVTIIISAWA